MGLESWMTITALVGNYCKMRGPIHPVRTERMLSVSVEEEKFTIYHIFNKTCEIDHMVLPPVSIDIW